jgi:hypothetical protein
LQCPETVYFIPHPPAALAKPTQPASVSGEVVEALRAAKRICERVRYESRHTDAASPDYRKGFTAGAGGCAVLILEEINKLAAASEAPAAPSIPEGMKPWHGADREPEDWDRGIVLYSRPDGSVHPLKISSEDSESWPQVVAYTPQPLRDTIIGILRSAISLECGDTLRGFDRAADRIIAYIPEAPAAPSTEVARGGEREAIFERDDQCNVEFGTVPDCDCPHEHWHVNGVCLDVHIEEDGTGHIILTLEDDPIELQISGVANIDEARAIGWAWAAKRLCLATTDALSLSAASMRAGEGARDAKTIAVEVLQSACETDPADPEHPDTIMITCGDLESIVRLKVELADERAMLAAANLTDPPADAKAAGHNAD